ncbi:MAG: hypothetical protein QMB63_06250 [Clostridiaceae bacterium]
MKATAIHRKSEFLLNDIRGRISEISNNETLKLMWSLYSKEYSYASRINYQKIIEAITELNSDILDK